MRTYLKVAGRLMLATILRPRAVMRFCVAYRRLHVCLGREPARSIVTCIAIETARAGFAFNIVVVADLAETAASFAAEDAPGEGQIRKLLRRAIMFRQIMAQPV